MKTCAYCCGKNLPFTREHIWSDCLIKKYEESRAYSKKENKFYKGDATIKDVCENCNSARLNQLDEYLCNLYDRIFHKILMPGESTRIEFDYDTLLRGLLKVSYNSARANASEKVVKAHRNLAKYILDGQYRPNVALRLLVVTASRTINRDTGATVGLLEPELLRCAEIPYDGSFSHRFSVRLVAINCYWFYLIIPYKNEQPHKWCDFFDGFSQWKIPSGLLISPSSKSLDIAVNQTTYFHPELLGSLLYAQSMPNDT